MIKPCSATVNRIQAYDPKLYVNWNNQDHVFEIWRRMPWGNRLITPVVSNIYDGKGGQGYCPLDQRIVIWLCKSDSTKLPKKWKWLDKIFYDKHLARKKRSSMEKFRGIAADNYNLFNQEMINPMLDDSEWLKPDVQSKSREKISYRSAENVKEYFDDTD